MDSILERNCRPGAKKVLIVATDGNSNDDDVLIGGRGLNGPVSDLREHGKRTEAIGLNGCFDSLQIHFLANLTQFSGS